MTAADLSRRRSTARFARFAQTAPRRADAVPAATPVARRPRRLRRPQRRPRPRRARRPRRRRRGARSPKPAPARRRAAPPRRSAAATPRPRLRRQAPQPRRCRIPGRAPPKPKRKPPPPPPPLRDRAVDRSRRRPFSREPSSPPPRPPSATRRSCRRAAGRPTSPPLRPGAKGAGRREMRKRLAIEGDLDPTRAPVDGLAVGRRTHRRGQALPGAHGAAPDRDRRRRDAEGDQRAGRGAPHAVRRRARSGLAGRQFLLRRPLCRRQHALDLGRGGRERQRRASLRRDRRRPRASLAGDLGAYLRSSISTRPGPCRSRSSRRRSFRRCSGIRAISRAPRSASSTARARRSIRDRSTGAPNAPPITRCGRIPGRAIRSARSASACPTSSPSTCTTRRRRGCSAPTTGSSATAACACRASTTMPNGCCRARRRPAGGWNKAALLAKMKDGEREDIKLAKAVPVIWVYLTGWSNGDGVANFRDDVYGIDVGGAGERPSAASRDPPTRRRRRRPPRRSPVDVRRGERGAPLAKSRRSVRRAWATPARGALMGNRGGRFHRDDQTLGAGAGPSKQWIACVCEFKGRSARVWGPGYTELFFLDEPTALAAGHRPCFECRRSGSRGVPARASLASRAARPRWTPCCTPSAARAQAPARSRSKAAGRRDDRARGARVRRSRRRACCRGASTAMARRVPRRAGAPSNVLTPPSIVAALAAGYAPRWIAASPLPPARALTLPRICRQIRPGTPRRVVRGEGFVLRRFWIAGVVVLTFAPAFPATSSANGREPTAKPR